jgi:hypothetical protein
MIRSPEQTTGQEFQEPPSWLWPPDPTPTHLEAEPQRNKRGRRGAARLTGDGVETEGSWWLRRAAAEGEDEEV